MACFRGAVGEMGAEKEGSAALRVSVQDVDVDVINKQIAAIFDDITVDAVKIGMVSRTETIRAVAAGLIRYKAKNIVVDPVMISKSGYFLLKPDAISFV